MSWCAGQFNLGVTYKLELYGNDLYPKSINQCLTLLNRWMMAKPMHPTHERDGIAPNANASPNKPPEKALVLAQDTNRLTKLAKDDSSSSKGSSLSSRSGCVITVHCKSCGQLGHASSVCPDRKLPPPDQIHVMDADDASVASYEEFEVLLTQQLDNLLISNVLVSNASCKVINKDFLLLDSQSTVHLFSNPNHVAIICPTSHPIRVHCNKGTKFTTEEADFGDMGVYFDESGIANVLSLFQLGKNITSYMIAMIMGAYFGSQPPKVFWSSSQPLVA